ncbi:MAG: hypothetical protein LAT63_00540 [Marinobacter sp.]|nr:hypothetical protein [Marinobacter sp.]
MFTINRENLRKSHQQVWLIIDFMMLGLLALNLTLIIFDSVYGFAAIQAFFAERAPDFAAFYQPVHDNFIFYDLIFVAIFLTEFAIRWVYAITTRQYARWYFYPFIHWYDLVGCIPIGTLRFLRILRVVSIAYRLHKYGIIDFTQTRLFQFLKFYYEAFLEELSDRIVIKVLSGVQEEVAHGSPLVERIRHDILLPRRKMITDWVSGRVAEAAAEGYVPNRGALRVYLEQRVDRALRQNVELSRLKFLPIVGPTIQDTLESAVGDIVAEVIHQILDDLASARNHDFIEDIVNVFIKDEFIEEHEAGNQELIQLIIEVLDAVKAQVSVKRWRQAL